MFIGYGFSNSAHKTNVNKCYVALGSSPKRKKTYDEILRRVTRRNVASCQIPIHSNTVCAENVLIARIVLLSMGESNTVLSACTKYRHLGWYCTHPSIGFFFFL